MAETSFSELVIIKNLHTHMYTAKPSSILIIIIETPFLTCHAVHVFWRQLRLRNISGTSHRLTLLSQPQQSCLAHSEFLA